MTLLGGGDIPISGDVHDGATVDVPDLGPLNPALAGVDAQLRIGSRTHERIYGVASTYGLRMAWGMRCILRCFPLRWRDCRRKFRRGCGDGLLRGSDSCCPSLQGLCLFD